MTPQEHQTALMQARRLLQDNAGNRLTLTLIEGLLMGLGGLLQPMVEKPAQEPAQEPGHG